MTLILIIATLYLRPWLYISKIETLFSKCLPLYSISVYSIWLCNLNFFSCNYDFISKSDVTFQNYNFIVISPLHTVSQNVTVRAIPTLFLIILTLYLIFNFIFWNYDFLVISLLSLKMWLDVQFQLCFL